MTEGNEVERSLNLFFVKYRNYFLFLPFIKGLRSKGQKRVKRVSTNTTLGVFGAVPGTVRRGLFNSSAAAERESRIQHINWADVLKLC
jgi:hypothetical protein